MNGGKGLAKVQLSRAAADADTVQKIKDGVIRNISVGYWTHKIIKTESDGEKVARWDVVDWEPLEISAVPIPADAGAQIRSASARRTKPLSDADAGAAMARRLLGKDRTRGQYRTPAASRKGPASEQRDMEAGAAMAKRALGKAAQRCS